MVWQLTSPWASDPRQRKKGAKPKMPFMSQPWKLHSHFCHVLSVRNESLSKATLKGRGIRLYLLKKGMSKNLWTYLKTIIESLWPVSCRREDAWHVLGMFLWKHPLSWNIEHSNHVPWSEPLSPRTPISPWNLECISALCSLRTTCLSQTGPLSAPDTQFVVFWEVLGP